jgi:hypothetical protein
MRRWVGTVAKRSGTVRLRRAGLGRSLDSLRSLGMTTEGALRSLGMTAGGALRSLGMTKYEPFRGACCIPSTVERDL